ncbi:Phage integrase family protein [Ruminococcus sp. YE71]|uniref:tyrosine-type recombinase/integrase n=1 Tax=unclassified Ruminococcus TaxID=2608920 RepID=UPI00088571F4|nr:MULTISPECIES: tyrosine-type recombinase/integrase [unclassified Ruminococcus]SDA32350.1 Phage integrase family protein [Ruminococcus sp. YE78]SFW53240.1 Phage integrase family protein [Ruminococcus sp. YE71]
MAYIEPRKNKQGEIIAYRIRVNKGYDKSGKKLKPYEMTFKPDPKKTERQNMKALNETAVDFEKKCRQGYDVDNKQTFSEYAEYVIALKERTGVKQRTIEGYRKLMPRVDEAIGHMKLTAIRPRQESMDLLREYQKWYEDMKSKYGDRWHDTNFLFFQEKSGNEGKPMNPDTVTRFLDEFSEKHGLPHINPHAFRHTMASVMCYNRIDPVSISRRLGHSKVSTTTDYYSHMLKDADDISGETIADVMFRCNPNNKTG